jgi:hypothetical protein
MIDENTYGIGIGYYALEDDEYALERPAFLARLGEFRVTVLECLETLPLGGGVRAFDLGHLVHVEVADGEQTADPVAWLRTVRDRLSALGIETLGVISYGGSWVAEADEAPRPELTSCGPVALCSLSYPSEPLRRVLYADTAARRDEDHPDGWGPGLYVDTEAIEPLGRKLKNAPTPLRAGGATYYRFGP